MHRSYVRLTTDEKISDSTLAACVQELDLDTVVAFLDWTLIAITNNSCRTSYDHLRSSYVPQGLTGHLNADA